ncbi:unnamed protein product [Pleuronectes platessa]|uniref:Uncharacterized protein n=1 Tax=Pleuronectes platessa TaxID=8262 RepID=A0A9N7VVH3_PLEPL|nr:unnamed protein product [Pleuronectes platessa]
MRVHVCVLTVWVPLDVKTPAAPNTPQSVHQLQQPEGKHVLTRGTAVAAAVRHGHSDDVACSLLERRRRGPREMRG